MYVLSFNVSSCFKYLDAHTFKEHAVILSCPVVTDLWSRRRPPPFGFSQLHPRLLSAARFTPQPLHQPIPLPDQLNKNTPSVDQGAPQQTHRQTGFYCVLVCVSVYLCVCV